MKRIGLIWLIAFMCRGLVANGQAIFTISGYVTDTSGRAVSGVGVDASGTYSVGTTTDTNGYYSLTVSNGFWDVGVDCDSLNSLGFLCTYEYGLDIDNGNEVVDFTVSAVPFQITGYVVNTSSNPISSVNIYGWEQNGPSSNGPSSFTQTMTDANGYYSLSVTNGDWDVSVDCTDLISNGCLCVNEQVLTISNGNAVLNFTAPLAAFQITGQVTDTSNDPVTNVDVYATAAIGGSSYWLDALTDSNGNYSFAVANGNWEVGVDTNELNFLGCQAVSGQSITISNNNAVVNFLVQTCGPPPILTTSLPPGHLGYWYYFQLQTSGCGQYGTWSVAPGSTPLPPGLTLDSYGELYGYPSTNGTFSFSVQLTAGNDVTGQALSLTVELIAPIFSAPVSIANGQFQTTVNGAVGQYYTIDFSTNLTDWLPLLTTNLSNGSSTIAVSTATNAAAFFMAYESGIAVSQSVISFAAPFFYANAADGSATIVVTRSNGLSDTVCVNYSAYGGTAVPYCDYEPVSGTICFPPNVTSNSFSVSFGSGCSGNQSPTVDLTLSDTNGIAILPAVLVIQRPKAVLAVYPSSLALIMPYNCQQTITISNAGPPGSLLNYTVADDGAFAGFLSLNGGGELVTGFLPAGYSSQVSFTVLSEFATNWIAGDLTTAVDIYTPGAANYVKYPISVEILNEQEAIQHFIVGTWSGTWSGESFLGNTNEGPVSGTWVLNVDDMGNGSMIWQGLDAFGTCPLSVDLLIEPLNECGPNGWNPTGCGSLHYSYDYDSTYFDLAQCGTSSDYFSSVNWFIGFQSFDYSCSGPVGYFIYGVGLTLNADGTMTGSVTAVAESATNQIVASFSFDTLTGSRTGP